MWRVKGDSWQKNWRRVLNWIHKDEQAKTLKLITDKIPKTIEAVKNLDSKVSCLKNLTEGFLFSDDLMDTLAHKRRSKKIFFQKMIEEGHPLINKVPVDNFEGGIKKLNKKEYTLTPEREKAITTSNYTFRTMNDYDVSLFNIFRKDFECDHRNDTRSNRRKAVPYHWSARTKQN